MSHLRNLFHTSSGHAPAPHAPEEHHSPDAPAAAVAQVLSTAVISSTATLAEFPVEQARITPGSRLIYYDDPRNPAADKIRYLRMRLREHWTAKKLKKLLVTSPLGGDGKSTITLNLATALAEHGRRSVLVIDADLHHASIAKSIKLPAWQGLTECLQDDSISPLAHIRRIEPLGWHLLPAGKPRRNPTELLQTPALRSVLEKVSAWFDWVLIDSPPVVPLTDAIAIQQHMDASLLVVRAGRTPQEAIQQTIDLLGKNKIVGIILNGIERRNQPYYQQGYYYGNAKQDIED
jgi:polysaccharide biosynthesis transport protein